MPRASGGASPAPRRPRNSIKPTNSTAYHLSETTSGVEKFSAAFRFINRLGGLSKKKLVKTVVPITVKRAERVMKSSSLLKTVTSKPTQFVRSSKNSGSVVVRTGMKRLASGKSVMYVRSKKVTSENASKASPVNSSATSRGVRTSLYTRGLCQLHVRKNGKNLISIAFSVDHAVGGARS